jgi:hypothetical protein
MDRLWVASAGRYDELRNPSLADERRSSRDRVSSGVRSRSSDRDCSGCSVDTGSHSVVYVRGVADRYVSGIRDRPFQIRSGGTWRERATGSNSIEAGEGDLVAGRSSRMVGGRGVGKDSERLGDGAVHRGAAAAGARQGEKQCQAYDQRGWMMGAFSNHWYVPPFR